ncbi:hypothetical protein EHS25_004801 [Saitozyma podzolica]|uniref:Uncharacterized protein n=1 Tax=Saitozyma podzolica TaxID=1890683 RepID=A0A427Y357_9TREE|nr:hypothetical protein EHS25_004801 [Saitozyma podzolica]
MPSTSDLLSRRCIGERFQQTFARPNLDWSISHCEDLKAMTLRDEGLSARESVLKARERAFETEEASLKAQMGRLALRASLSPPPEDNGPHEAEVCFARPAIEVSDRLRKRGAMMPSVIPGKFYFVSS